MASVTVGYKYYLGIHLVTCHGPVDKLLRIDVDDRKAWEGDIADGSVVIDAPELFGGEEREGGVSGTVDIAMGGPTQLVNDYLVSKLGADIPAYRGVVSCILRQCYVGMNPYIKRWGFWFQRIHKRFDGSVQWYDAKAQIGQGMNGAHIIRECLTDELWGMGQVEADMDDDYFMAAADQLYNEGAGYSILWDKSQPIGDFITTVLKHMNASLYVSRSTGKYRLKLARADYDVDTIPVIDQSSGVQITKFRRAAIGELVNSVTVVYWDETTGKNNSVTVQDIALAAQQGCTINTTIQYPGITTGELATAVAQRDLKTLSSPLASAIIYADRNAADLNVGDVFKLVWPRFGITQLVMRVVDMELGEFSSNLVKLTVVEDVFGLAESIYAPPTSSQWVDPVGVPVPVPYRVFMETPYYFLAREMGDSDAANLPATAAYGVVLGSNPGGGSASARVNVDEGAGYVDRGVLNYCPTCVIDANYGPADTVFDISSGEDLDLVTPGMVAIMGDGASNQFELVEVVSVTDNLLTVKRGMLDTPPKETLVVGTRVMFFGKGEFAAELPIEYAKGESISVKLLPSTGKGTLAIGSAPSDTLVMEGRQDKPYPPGQVRVNGVSYPTVAITIAPTMTWAHRDRLQQTGDSLIDQSVGSIGPEAGVEYVARIRDASDDSLLEEIITSGTSAAFNILSVSGVPNVRFELFSRLVATPTTTSLAHRFVVPFDVP